MDGDGDFSSDTAIEKSLRNRRKSTDLQDY
jgi:hypothetical protein